MGTYQRRKFIDGLMRWWCMLATLLAVIPLFSVLAYVLAKGAGGLSWNFFIELPKPIGESGGGGGGALLG
ncbi:MAG: hypothetical protein FWB81_07810, partial [Cystobacterineae bacterium]|nr:hypothetical protein [Cystobacterineae bacterium]